ncbi:MAG: hypothetical protein AAFN30_08950, partial [Actinomycetota bacterium]
RPAASADDRSDDALATGTVAVGGDPSSVVAHLDGSGDLAFSTFAEDLNDLDPGRGRLTVRHLLAGGPLDVAINDDVVTTLEPGQEATFELDAGPVSLAMADSNGTTVATADIALDDGRLAALSAIGSIDDDTAELVAQFYGGLSTAPAGVPTGDSGLLGLEDDNELVFAIVTVMMVAMVAGGTTLALRRRRNWS